jgi:large subunit ribosomal protein L5
MAQQTQIARLKTRYEQEIRPELIRRFGYSTPMQAPKIKKITLNMGVGDAKQDTKALEAATEQLATIAGQRPSVRRARKSIAAFKLREGMPVGVSVTLRGERSYEFLDRLMSVAIPRIRDFRGMNPRSFDGRGNYSLGVREQIIFPEIDYDAIDQTRGLDITITTNASSDLEAFVMLDLFGFPFAQEGRPAGAGPATPPGGAAEDAVEPQAAVEVAELEAAVEEAEPELAAVEEAELEAAVEEAELEAAVEEAELEAGVDEGELEAAVEEAEAAVEEAEAAVEEAEPEAAVEVAEPDGASETAETGAVEEPQPETEAVEEPEPAAAVEVEVAEPEAAGETAEAEAVEEPEPAAAVEVAEPEAAVEEPAVEVAEPEAAVEVAQPQTAVEPEPEPDAVAEYASEPAEPALPEEPESELAQEQDFTGAERASREPDAADGYEPMEGSAEPTGAAGADDVPPLHSETAAPAAAAETPAGVAEPAAEAAGEAVADDQPVPDVSAAEPASSEAEPDADEE